VTIAYEHKPFEMTVSLTSNTITYPQSNNWFIESVKIKSHLWLRNLSPLSRC